ncbi:tRNA-guanine transglycosylase, partial [Bacillus pseudomycoides]|uniref:tRNA-guanine transglycosylase n=1 Tax=Bacillus pseudomycoides TaxID=64104 RepID=UPI002847DB31
RNGTCMTSQGRRVEKNAKFARDFGTLDRNCACNTWKTYSRTYIRHLMKCDERSGIRLTSYHNLHFLLHLIEQVRQAIREDRLGDIREEF